MKVTWKMVDRELRLTAFIINLFSVPWLWLFKLVNRLSNRFRGANIEGLNCEELWILRSGGDSKIRVRVYKPLSVTRELPVMLYLHGGGYALTVPEMSHPIIESFIQERECIVVAPEYRRSLEEPYPAAIDDCYDTLKWVAENAQSLGVRDDQIIVAGHSAGGGLTAAISLMARDRKEVNIAFQMPIYPMIDDRMTTESASDNNAPVWNSKLNSFAWDLYLKRLKENGEPIPSYAAPSRETDYSELPPTATFVGDLEPFRDETIEYVNNLRAVGVPVKFELFEGCFHGFDAMVPKAEVSSRATRFMLDCYAYGVDNYFSTQGMKAKN
jgi:acetyl esterase/lipase